MERVILCRQAEAEDLTIEYYVVSEPICPERVDIIRYGVIIREIYGFQFLNEIILKNLFFDEDELSAFIDILAKYKVKTENAVDFLLGYLMAKNFN